MPTLNTLYTKPQFVEFVDLLDKYDWHGFYKEVGLVHEYDIEAKYIWEFYKKNQKIGVEDLANIIQHVYASMLMCIPPWEECLECSEKFLSIMRRDK